MRWLTREKVRVDRVACPWLIQRFIDPEVELVFLPLDKDWSRVDGIVFDTPGAEVGHHGESVSLVAILDRYKWNDPALRLLAEIVRAASSHQPALNGRGTTLNRARLLRAGHLAPSNPRTRVHRLRCIQLGV